MITLDEKPEAKKSQVLSGARQRRTSPGAGTSARPVVLRPPHPPTPSSRKCPCPSRARWEAAPLLPRLP